MTTRLIINSDDYGRTPEVSLGIRQAHLGGIVTSSTAMMNMPAVVADLRLALQETLNLGLGVHLVLTSGRPLLPPEQAPSLVDEAGAFHQLAAFTKQRAALDLAEVRAEWRAQIEKFIAATSRRPTHLDSHHHASYFTAGLFRTMLELAQEYGCAIRLPVALGNDDTFAGLPPEVIGPIQEYAPRLLAEFRPRRPGAFFANFYDEGATRDELLRILERAEALHPPDQDLVAEVMCHPGYADSDLVNTSGYATQRENELEILTDPAMRSAIQQRGMQLISFAGL